MSPTGERAGLTSVNNLLALKMLLYVHESFSLVCGEIISDCLCFVSQITGDSQYTLHSLDVVSLI